jgi:hypothetical protein
MTSPGADQPSFCCTEEGRPGAFGRNRTTFVFGPAAPPSFRDVILGLRAKWAPIVEADRAGTLNVDVLSAEDRAVWRSGTPLGAVPVTLAWLSAMLEWPSLEPASMTCPTLWLVGTANENAMSSVNEYALSLERTKVTPQLVPGLTHERELTEVEVSIGAPLEYGLTRRCTRRRPCRSRAAAGAAERQR